MEAVLSPSTEVWGSYRVMAQEGKTISRPLRMDVVFLGGLVTAYLRPNLCYAVPPRLHSPIWVDWRASLTINVSSGQIEI